MVEGGNQESRRPEGRRLIALDGLRGIAAAMVLLLHVDLPGAAPLTGGMDAGVLIFFALSGYLLYAPFTRGPVDLRAYAIRRVLRIFPAYLVAAVGIGWLFYPETLNDPVGVLTMSHTSVIVAWTLQLELAFYAVLPLAALGLRRVPAQSRVFALVVVAAVSVTATLGIMAVRLGMDGQVTTRELTTVVSFAWAFVPGMIVALLPAVRRPAWWAVAGIALIALSCWLDLAIYLDLAAGVGAGLLIAYLVGRPSIPRWAERPAIVAGALSYSVYLWHEALVPALDRPTSTWAGGATVIGLTVAIAAVIYVLVERPAIRLGQRLGRRLDQVPESPVERLARRPTPS